MARKKKKIKYKKERVILSEVLPYELPLTFSNRHFYEFLLENKVEYKNNTLRWKKAGRELDAIICLFFGLNIETEIETRSEKVNKLSIDFCSIKINPKHLRTIPFSYKIKHKAKEHRELTICHPRNQLKLIDFYHQHKEIILYYCRDSPFSIRKPNHLSKYVYHKDKIHRDRLSKEPISIEEYGKEYESLRSFFVYKEISNIYKFYESYKYHHCEKKYNELLTLDISKCFDSIYTHTLSWALLNKDIVKQNVLLSNDTFGGKFDTLMRQLNHNETSGIIVGPEFSRIFAELILQAIDKQTLEDLKNKPHFFSHKRDYEIFRYVDDYFIFFNDEPVKDAVVDVLQLNLRLFKLYLNHNKAVLYKKPIITDITRAKHRISKLIEKNLKYKLELIQPEEQDGDESENNEENANGKNKQGEININSKLLITQFKIIIKECDVQYKDLLNWSLAIIEKKSKKIIEDYKMIEKKKNSEANFIKAIWGILDFTFFIYSVSPRVNTTIRLCRILSTYIRSLKTLFFNNELTSPIYKLIFDNILFILKKNKCSDHTQVETLYLLLILSDLGKEYWLDQNALCSFFGIEIKTDGIFETNRSLNYLSITILLYYIRKKQRYDSLRSFIEIKILEKFNLKQKVLNEDAELTLLLFDCISCPYISNKTKNDILQICGILENELRKLIINFRIFWFTKWKDFDLMKEFSAKKSQEVY